jgi:hypothetical protein
MSLRSFASAARSASRSGAASGIGSDDVAVDDEAPAGGIV